MPGPSNPPGRRSAGFTLIELLVSLVIAALLGSLTLAAVQRGMVKAGQAACSSNLRQIGAAIALYAADNEGRLPTTSHTGGIAKSWIYLLAGYLDDVDAVRICPADPIGKKRLAEHGTSYTLNSVVFNPAYDADGNSLNRLDRLHLIPKPAQTILAFNVSDQKTGIGADHTHSETWRNWVSVLADITPDRFRAGKASSDRTKGSSNYLYADGHVENLAAEKLRELINQGINPADPPP